MADESDAVHLTQDVAPLWERHCIRCHHPGDRNGDISLETNADLAASGYVVPGEPDQSHFMERVTPPRDGGRPTMPDTGDPLAEDELAMLRRWIAAGAVWPDTAVIRRRRADRDWWSLVPLAVGTPPELNDAPGAWTENPIDRFVLEHLAGGVIGPGDPNVEVGTGFMVCGPYDNVGNQDAAQAAIIRADTLDEMLRATSEAFLGLTVGCARCHDRKVSVDPPAAG